MPEEKKVKNHHDHGPVKEGNLMLATLLNLVITLVELAGGILANSLALLSDALHNLSDTFATFIAYVATRVSRRKATEQNTFGYKRVEILAAMLNAIILVIICIFLFKEAVERIRHPEPIKPLVVIIVAMVGLGANLLAVALLRNDSRKSINVKAAYVHLIGDSLSSVVVIMAAVAIQLFDFYWIDPVVTIAIGLYLIREAYVILKEAVSILMQSTPHNLDLVRLQSKIEAVPGVCSMHHIHEWRMNDHDIHMEPHIEIAEDRKISELEAVRKDIEKILRSRYHIHHITLQFEYKPDHSKSLISKGE